MNAAVAAKKPHRWGRWLLAGLGLYLLALLCTTPAATVWSWVEKSHAPGELPQLYAMKGTVWRGEAQQLVSPELTLNDLHWKFRPLSLLTFKPAYHVTARTTTGLLEGNIATRTGQRVTVSDLQASLPLTELPLPPVMRGVPLDADVLADIDTLTVENGRVLDVTGQLDALNLRLTDGSKTVMGGVKLAVTTVDGNISALVSDDGGPLKAVGDISLAPDGRYAVEVQLRPPAGLPPTFNTLFAMAGRRLRDGSIDIQQSGVIPGYAPAPKLETEE